MRVPALVVGTVLGWGLSVALGQLGASVVVYALCFYALGLAVGCAIGPGPGPRGRGGYQPDARAEAHPPVPQGTGNATVPPWMPSANPDEHR